MQFVSLNTWEGDPCTRATSLQAGRGRGRSGFLPGGQQASNRGQDPGGGWQDGRDTSEVWGPALSTIILDDWFRADSSHFPLYFVTNFVWGVSEQDEFFLELQDWVRAGQISAGAGRLIYFNMSAAEWQSKAWGDWILWNWKENLEFYLCLTDFYSDLTKIV